MTDRPKTYKREVAHLCGTALLAQTGTTRALAMGAIHV